MRGIILPGGLLLGLALQLVVGHGDNGEDEVDEVEGAQENVEDEEDDVEWTACHEGDLNTMECLLDSLSEEERIGAL